MYKKYVVSILISLCIYLIFAGAVFIIQGNQPDLNIDHIAYFKLVEKVQAEHPDGAYWKSFSDLNSYAVLISYVFWLTGSMIQSFKWVLAIITVAYLFAFELFMSLFTLSKWKRVLFALLSAIHVSFGATFWGFTDFAASLNRSIVVPFMVVGLWFFLKNYDSKWKYTIFSILVLLSTLHLSALYLLGILIIFEFFDILLLREAKIDKNFIFFIFGLSIAFCIKKALGSFLGATQYVSNKVFQAIHASQIPGILNPQQAWEMELYVFPWRNMPLPTTTLALIILSYGIILFLALWGCRFSFKQGWNKYDKIMAVFMLSVFLGAYGFQTLLWILRSFTDIYPMNFEEVRAINFIIIPSIYFIFRLRELLIVRYSSSVKSFVTSVLLVLLILIQPIVLIQSVPLFFKEKLIEKAVVIGIINKEDSLRVNYARQLLGINNSDSRRFYYSSRAVVDWLSTNVSKNSKVMTECNDIFVPGIQFIGPFIGVLANDISSTKQEEWKQAVQDVHEAIVSNDINRVLSVAKSYGAEYVIVPWNDSMAIYSDSFYSVIKVDLEECF